MNFPMVVRATVGLRLMNMLARMGRFRLGRWVLMPMVLIVAMRMAVGQSGMFMCSFFHPLLLFGWFRFSFDGSF